MDNDLEKLEQAIRGLQKPTLGHDTTSRIKDRLYSHIQNKQNINELEGKRNLITASYVRLGSFIKEVANKVAPSYDFKARIKEKVLAFAEMTTKSYSFRSTFVYVGQRVFAAFMITAILGSSFVVYLADIPFTHASSSTKLLEVHGTVEVIRNNEFVEVSENMDLEEGDVIVTGQSGIAVVRYIDDSVTRLSPETEIKLNTLFQDENNTATIVDIELVKGRMWSNVVNLVNDESSFTVTADDIVAVSTDKAAFDIKNEEKGIASVAVFDNKINVTVEENPIFEEDSLLLEGYSLETDKDTQKIEIIDENQDEDSNEVWVKVNKGKDKEYIETIEGEKAQETKDEAGLLPEDPLYIAKKISESTKLLITPDGESKEELKIDIAQKRLREATTLLASGNDERAKELLNEYQELIDEILASTNDLDSLKERILSQIEEDLKDLATISPDSELYVVKVVLRDAEIDLADNPIEKQEVVLEHASEILIEAKDLVEEDKEKFALEVIEELQDEIEDIQEETITIEEPLDQIDEELIDGLVEAELDTQASIEILIDSIEQQSEENTTELIDAVTETTEEIEDTLDVEISPTNETASGAETTSESGADTTTNTTSILIIDFSDDGLTNTQTQ